MTLTIDANVVWKPRNILRVVAAKVDDTQEFKILKTVMMRVLTAFLERVPRWSAIEELGGEPWQPFPDVGT